MNASVFWGKVARTCLFLLVLLFFPAIFVFREGAPAGSYEEAKALVTIIGAILGIGLGFSLIMVVIAHIWED